MHIVEYNFSVKLASEVRLNVGTSYNHNTIPTLYLDVSFSYCSLQRSLGEIS